VLQTRDRRCHSHERVRDVAITVNRRRKACCGLLSVVVVSLLFAFTEPFDATQLLMYLQSLFKSYMCLLLFTHVSLIPVRFETLQYFYECNRGESRQKVKDYVDECDAECDVVLIHQS
jgi:hypothetical protein